MKFSTVTKFKVKLAEALPQNTVYRLRDISSMYVLQRILQQYMKGRSDHYNQLCLKLARLKII